MAFKQFYKCAPLLLALLTTPVFAENGFVVKKIEVDGLQRVPLQTVLEYLPVHEGQTLSSADTASLISSLYKTGFFSDVKLARNGNTLIIQVIERSTIGFIKISGNKKIKTKDLMDALHHAGIMEGEGVDQATLSAMQHALLEQYYALGHYDATVNVTLVPQTRNRVEIDIVINEGHVAKVQEINLIGNQHFSSKKILRQIKLAPHHWWDFFSSNDEYSAEKLQQSLNDIRDYYFDRGYLKFTIDSSQVTITPNRKDVYITIHVTEGGVYHIQGYGLDGNLLGQEASVRKLIRIKPNEVFSRRKIVAIQELITRFYADQGYAMASVKAVPTLDDEKRLVYLTFHVEPGRRVYVRHIEFYGNVKTSEEVFRRESRQMEGALYSASGVDETKRRLNNLGYLDSIDVTMDPVPGNPNLVDLNYHLKEGSSTTASGQVGYSDTYGLQYGGSIVQKNFMGEGKAVSLGFNNSQYAQNYTLSYFNPYYTISGISRGFSLYYQITTPGNGTSVAPYTLDALGGMVNYRIPMSEYDYFAYGYGYEYLHIKTGSPSIQMTDFIDDNGSQFNNVKGTASWIHNSLDRAIFPTKGFNQGLTAEVGLPILPQALDYFKFNYSATWFQPIWKGIITELNANIGYGNAYGYIQDGLPFFKNYYAGGIGTVRGYQSNTLGPRDSNGNPFGGNILTTASFNVIVPTHISEKLRASLFLDAGNVYEQSWSSAQIVFSSGIEVDWLSPLGLLKLSLAAPLSAGQEREPFQFSAGTSF